jgi:hypothetical protein
MSNIREYPLYFEINNVSYYSGSIRALANSIELYYHFPWGSRSPSKYQDVRTNKIDNWHLPDHISFHKNGRIHTKLKDEKKKKLYLEPIEIEINPFNLERGHFLPIYLESFFVEDKEWVKKRLKPENPSFSNATVWNLNSIKNFSLLIISKCGSVDPLKMTQTNKGLNKLTFIDQPVVIQNFFTKEEKDKLPNGSKSERSTELIIMLVRETIPKSKPIFDEKEGEGINVNTFHLIPTLEHLEMLTDIN